MSPDMRPVSGSHEPTENTPEHLLSQIQDAELLDACTQMLGELDIASQRLDAISARETLPVPTKKLSQTHVDGIIRDSLGEASLDEANELAAFFTMFRTERPKDSEADSELRSVLLSAFIADRKLLSRADAKYNERRFHGKGRVTQVKKIVEHGEQLDMSSSVDKLVDATHEMAQFARATFNKAIRHRQSSQESNDELEKSAAADEARNMLAEIDPTLRLDTVKYLLYTNIAHCLKQPQIFEAFDAMADDDEVFGDLIHSKFGYHYCASYIIDEPQALSEIRQEHTSNRFFRIPSRQFKEEFSRIESLLGAFEAVTRLEKDLETIAQGQHLNQNMYDKSINAEVAKISLQMFKAAHAMDHTIESRLGDTTTFDSPLLQEILKVENIQRTAVGELIKKAQGALEGRPEQLSGFLEKHQILTAARWEESFKNAMRKAEQEKLQPVIEAYVSEYMSIDKSYDLTHRRLRERQPGFMQLVKEFRESLDTCHDEVYSDDMLNKLVGLMHGVYWERTGARASQSEQATKYLEDAREIRAISLELQRLNQETPGSHLLPAINMLDELIDSGLFDDIDKEEEPVLAQYIDFVDAYLAARDGIAPQRQTEAVSQPEIEEDKGDDDKPLPLETMRQAVQEDLLVFPPGVSAEEVMRDYNEQIEEGDTPTVEWERIQKLIDLRDQFAKQKLEVNFIRTKHASWQVLPFFVLEVKLPQDEHAVAVVESPVYGNATYIYSESDDRLPWRDVIQESRKDAREWGAVPAVHVDSEKLDKHAKKIWDRVISELTVYR